MAGGANQKLKLLYLKQFFEEKTDEEHPATMQQILDYLKANGVDAERKSIYTKLSDSLISQHQYDKLLLAESRTDEKWADSQ